MKRKRLMILGIIASLLMVMMWQVVHADAPTVTHPAQKQVNQIMASLIDSEAEHANGAYFPGAGAFITMDLLRGPNSTKKKASYEGTRDWLIYLMQTFGPKLTEVPPAETIGMSVEFYDYAQVFYHQLVITCRAGDVSDPGKYNIWLDGKPYAEAVGQPGGANPAPAATTPAATAKANASPAANPSPAATSTPGKNLTPATTGGETAASQVGPRLTPLAGTFKLLPDLTSAQSGKDWNVVNGQWDFTGQGYKQSELGKFDLISFYNRPLAGNFHLQTDLKYLEGEMGGGLVFNAPGNNTKKGAQMVSFTGKGSYLQWGYYDSGGIFQYQGGTPVTNMADGQNHTLEVKLTGNAYDVSLDGKTLGQKIPVQGTAGGYVGLLASTSRVLFSNITLESIQ
jgi:hypothetical protein